MNDFSGTRLRTYAEERRAIALEAAATLIAGMVAGHTYGGIGPPSDFLLTVAAKYEDYLLNGRTT